MDKKLLIIFCSGYKVDLEKRKAEKAKLEEERQRAQIEKVRTDLSKELDPNMRQKFDGILPYFFLPLLR